jgi:hypothetical protein
MKTMLAAMMLLMPTVVSAGFYDGNKLNMACHTELASVTGYLAGW